LQPDNASTLVAVGCTASNFQLFFFSVCANTRIAAEPFVRPPHTLAGERSRA